MVESLSANGEVSLRTKYHLVLFSQVFNNSQSVSMVMSEEWLPWGVCDCKGLEELQRC